MKPKKVAVIGRGIAGLSAARSLAMRGHKVFIIAPLDEVGIASYTSQGVSTIKGLLFGRSAVFQAKLAGHRFLKSWLGELQSQTGREIFNNFNNAIEPFADEREFQMLRSRIYKLNWSGANRVHLLGPSSIGAYCPYSMALSHPGDGFVEPKSLLLALLQVSLKLGAINIEESVIGLGYSDVGGWHVKSSSGSTLLLDEVIIAAGKNSAAVASTVGLRVKTKSSLGFTLSWTIWDKESSQAYLFGKSSLVLANGLAKFGSHENQAQEFHSSIIDQDGPKVLEKLKTTLPTLTLPPDISDGIKWGYRQRALDGHPLVGDISLGARRIFFATGLHKSGLQLAPLAGEMIADKISGIPTTQTFWQEFSPQRRDALAL